jgi:omega-6 fatty acid desaturase (delta-12 desaturase)
LTEGEGHVPDTIESRRGQAKMRLRDFFGPDAWALKDIVLILALGWPIYLIFGISGCPKNGFTSHFIVPNKLFPKEKLGKVMLSNLGIGISVYLLYLWAQRTSFLDVLAVYIGPYLVVNMWLTGYTWLHHIDENVPHYDEDGWNWLKGALCTIDRSYPEYINTLHFNIGSTHVVHHLFSALPHYNARKANNEIKKVLGDRYIFDSRNVWRSFWEVAKLGVLGKNGKGTWNFITKYPFFVEK